MVIMMMSLIKYLSNVHTFHSFCSNILRTYGQNYLGTLVNNNHSFNSQFSILSEDDSIRVIKKLFRQNQITHLNESRVFNQIIQQKYKIRGNKKFIDRKEVQDILSYIRLLVNPRNVLSCQRNINSPSRGIGEKSQIAFFKWMEDSNQEFIQKNHIPPTIMDYLYALRFLSEHKLSDGEINYPINSDIHHHNHNNNQSNMKNETDDDGDDDIIDNYNSEQISEIDENLHLQLAHLCPLNQREKKVLSKYALLMTNLHQQSKRIPLPELMNNLLTQIDYRNYLSQLNDNDPEIVADKWANIEQILHTAEKLTKNSNSSNSNNSNNSNNSHSKSSVLDNFIEFYDSFSSASDEDLNQSEIEEDGVVELMTIHASKGLEFDVVVLSGAEEGTLPIHSAAENEQIEEEKRLAYVAITRAKNILIITYRKLCSKIRSNGSHFRVKTSPSRFFTCLKTLPTSQCVWVHS